MERVRGAAASRPARGHQGLGHGLTAEDPAVPVPFASTAKHVRPDGFQVEAVEQPGQEFGHPAPSPDAASLPAHSMAPVSSAR